MKPRAGISKNTSSNGVAWLFYKVLCPYGNIISYFYDSYLFTLLYPWLPKYKLRSPISVFTVDVPFIFYIKKKIIDSLDYSCQCHIHLIEWWWFWYNYLHFFEFLPLWYIECKCCAIVTTYIFTFFIFILIFYMRNKLFWCIVFYTFIINNFILNI